MVIENGYDVMITYSHNAAAFPPNNQQKNISERNFLYSDRTNQNESFNSRKFG
ncbi:hypothetical protein SAMN05880574_12139 [Chryseobacterium sp. RU37D]|nr:hypothetical protein SAMN05880574_12139 [Chryseobacterium sp. RU37D]